MTEMNISISSYDSDVYCQQSSRTDFIVWAFKLQLNELIDDTIKKHTFEVERTVALIFVIEFQKCASSHCNMLIMLMDKHKLRDSSSIDEIDYSEISNLLQ